jgi:single-stranded-DNA-specific exonuclease
MDHASRAADVLLARTRESAEQAADLLSQMNQERQRLTQKTVRAIPGNILLNSTVVVAASPHWRLGVLGLVANKLVAAYKKPAILVRAGHPAVGVARSTPEIHIANTFALLSHCFDRFGGHAGAGGFALKESVSLEEFVDALARVSPVTG